MKACENEYEARFGHPWKMRPIQLDLEAAKTAHAHDVEAHDALGDLKEAAQRVLSIVSAARGGLAGRNASSPSGPLHERLLERLVDEYGEALHFVADRKLKPSLSSFNPLASLLDELARPHPNRFWRRAPGRPGNVRLPYGDVDALSNREIAVIYVLADRGRSVALTAGMTVAEAIEAYRRAVKQARSRRR